MIPSHLLQFKKAGEKLYICSKKYFSSAAQGEDLGALAGFGADGGVGLGAVVENPGDVGVMRKSKVRQIR